MANLRLVERVNMSPDAALVIFTSLGFASVFLALVIGITGHHPADPVTSLANMKPDARRQAKFKQIQQFPNWLIPCVTHSYSIVYSFRGLIARG